MLMFLLDAFLCSLSYTNGFAADKVFNKESEFKAVNFNEELAITKVESSQLCIWNATKLGYYALKVISCFANYSWKLSIYSTSRALG